MQYLSLERLGPKIDHAEQFDVNRAWSQWTGQSRRTIMQIFPGIAFNHSAMDADDILALGHIGESFDGQQSRGAGGKCPATFTWQYLVLTCGKGQVDDG